MWVFDLDNGGRLVFPAEPSEVALRKRLEDLVRLGPQLNEPPVDLD